MASDVYVKLDDRIRLIAAALAATSYPDDAQVRHRHGTHAHARATRRLLADFADHEAVRSLQALLDHGAPLEAVFTLALVLPFPDGNNEQSARWTPPRWMPPHWDDQLMRFYADADLAAWWQSEAAAWQTAFEDASRTFENVHFKPFLQPYLGEIDERLIFAPNILYPTDQTLGLRFGSDLVCIAPPRVAWGDSPPWPFDEDPAHVYRAAIEQYGFILMDAYLRAHAERIIELAQTPLPVTEQYRALYPTWAEQFAHLFVAGAVAIYLEDHVSQAEASAYVLMERKVSGLEVLPGVIHVFRRYLRELESGNYTSLLDLLPNFSRQLKVANKIASL